MNEIIGYKAFKSDLTNKYGFKFEVGVEYKESKDLKFGINGGGFHFASCLADTFRYFNPKYNPVYCKIVGSGNFIKVSNYAYDSKDMYVSEKIKITKILTRDEILEYALTSDLDTLNKMLMLYSFNKEELELIKRYCLEQEKEYLKSIQILDMYQTGDIKTFKRERRYTDNYIIIGDK